MKIQYDELFVIACGRSCTSINWKNKSIRWSEFLDGLSKPKYSSETVAEYQAMSKADRDKIKGEVGGFVGGKLKQNGPRKKETVESRHLITLDIDYGSKDIWETQITFLFEYACCLYSTHSHRKEDYPRYRLIIPLKRAVTPEEYEALARIVASQFDIEIFDDTTYQHYRLMYWQSSPRDGEYVFKYQDAEWLDPDKVLSEFGPGWKDIEKWPRSSRERKGTADRINTANKQADPLEKPGMIGAFNRAYFPISKAIDKFLSDVYSESVPGRYTYIKGSGYNGVVIYDDKFSFSNHSTDPVSGIECNAFDLVRLHLFGDQDAGIVRSNTRPENYPSFKMMMELAGKDSETLSELLKDEFTAVEGEFTNEEVEERKEAAAKYLIPTKNGLKVNTGLLARHIRDSSHYMVVRKQGLENDILYWYERGCYRRISPSELKGRIKGYIPESIRTPNHWENTYKELVTDVKCVSFEELDTDENYINMINGLYNVRTGKLQEHDPDLKTTIQINCEYNPDAEEPEEWLKYIDTLTDGDSEKAAVLQEFFGVALSNIDMSNLKKCLVLWGAVGNTGKTQLLKLLIDFLGTEFICTTPIQKLADRFATSDLYGKRMLVIDDQTAMNMQDSSTFKALTGGGTIPIEFKGKQTFSYHPRCGVLISCNDLPYFSDDKGEHVYDRFIILPCDNVIPEGQRIKNIVEKLFLPEKEGIFLWALEGLNRLRAKNFRFTRSTAAQSANEEYKQMNDTIYKFLCMNYTVTRDKKDRIKKTEFEDDYWNWTRLENDGIGVSKRNIKDRMTKHGISISVYNGLSHYIGLKKNYGF